MRNAGTWRFQCAADPGSQTDCLHGFCIACCRHSPCHDHAFALVLTRSDSILPNRFIYGILNTIINTVRSVPFIILMVFIMPLTKMVVGTRIGTTAALVPLVIFIAPYLTRLLKTPCLMSIEASLKPLRRWEHPILKSFGIFSCRKQKDPSSFPLRQGQSAF